jgi:pyruvate kinase
VSRGILPVIAADEWKGETGHPQEVMRNAIVYARDVLGLVKTGDHIVGVHRVMGEAVLKVVQCP